MKRKIKARNSLIMDLITKLPINDQYRIELLVPPVEEKENTFCKPTTLLHNCDIITALLITPNAKCILYKDHFQSFIYTTISRFSRSINKDKMLPSNVEPGSVGYFYNTEKYYYSSGDTLNYASYWLWSTNEEDGGVQSWLYSKDNVIYLEIAPSYDWLQIEAPVEDDKKLFQEFIDNYKPILCAELSAVTVKNWIEQCEYLDSIIAKPE